MSKSRRKNKRVESEFRGRDFRRNTNRTRLHHEILLSRYVFDNIGLSDNVYSDKAIVFPHREQVTYAHRNVNKAVSRVREGRDRLKGLITPLSVAVGEMAKDNELLRQKVCRARQVRKEVLHALGKTGEGSGGKSPQYTELSKIKC